MTIKNTLCKIKFHSQGFETNPDQFSNISLVQTIGLRTFNTLHLLIWLVKVLLNDGGAPVNLEDNDKATPLHAAAQAGQTQVIQKLVSHSMLINFN